MKFVIASSDIPPEKLYAHKTIGGMLSGNKIALEISKDFKRHSAGELVIELIESKF